MPRVPRRHHGGGRVMTHPPFKGGQGREPEDIINSGMSIAMLLVVVLISLILWAIIFWAIS